MTISSIFLPSALQENVNSSTTAVTLSFRAIKIAIIPLSESLSDILAVTMHASFELSSSST